MSELNEKQRDRLDEDQFAFPKERKEPLNNASHVRNAIARFNQVEGVSDDERDAAWRRINTAADKHGPFVADARQQGADRPADRVGWIFHGLGTSMFLSHKFVLGAQKSAFLRGFCTWLFRVPR